MTTTAAEGHDTRFFGHPIGLANLFGVEMWERFSFYGMQAILAYYLYHSVTVGGLGMSEASATSIVGGYGGFVYLSAIGGAWIADRLFGSERVLFYSAVLIMLGHISLALLPGFLGVGVGLTAIALGTGGLKANATSLVGSLYSADDERRDGGFSLFYLGINLGAFIGPLLTGLAQEKVNFDLGFGLAAIGMALGLVQYTIGRKNLGPNAGVVPNPLPREKRPLVAVAALAIAGVAVLVVVTGLVTAANFSTVTVFIIIVAAVAYFAAILSSKQITDVERKRVFSFIPMFIATFVFFALFQQQFTAVAIYIDKRLNRNIFGWEMPAAWGQSINPIFIIVLAGVFAAIWTKLGPRQPSTPIKFALGTAAMGASFLLFLPYAGGSGQTTPLLWLVLILFGFTVAELLLSPVGLSLSTKLAPKNFKTQLVALNFLAIALGTALAGTLTSLGIDEQAETFKNEFAYFLWIGLAAIAVGVLLAVFSPFIRKLMSGVH